MPEEAPIDKKTSLVEAIARGQSVKEWAEENEAPPRTAFRWASEPEVRREVEATRRRALDRAIGCLSDFAINAAGGIIRLGKEAESESVQLRALQAVLADNMAVSKFSDLEYRMTEVEEQIRERTGQTNPAR
jgi:hypothetical protein